MSKQHFFHRKKIPLRMMMMMTIKRREMMMRRRKKKKETSRMKMINLKRVESPTMPPYLLLRQKSLKIRKEVRSKLLENVIILKIL